MPKWAGLGLVPHLPAYRVVAVREKLVGGRPADRIRTASSHWATHYVTHYVQPCPLSGPLYRTLISP